MLRDHELKTAVGKIEDDAEALFARLVVAHHDAEKADATGHAEFYETVARQVGEARHRLTQAYTLLLNGDESLGVEPLGDES